MHGNVVVNQCEIAGLPRDVEGDFTGESASGGFGDCNFPHPTSTTAATVISSCFIMRIFKLLIINYLRIACFLGHTFGHTFSASIPKNLKYKESGEYLFLA